MNETKKLKLPGRPKKTRRREPNEQPSDSKGCTRLSRKGHAQITCTKCQKKGHNIRRCPLNHAVDAVLLEGSGTQPPLNSNKCRKCKGLGHNVRTCPLIVSGTSNTQATQETHVSASTTITEVDSEPFKNMAATESNSGIIFF